MLKRWHRLTRTQKILVCTCWPLWIPAFALYLLLLAVFFSLEAVHKLSGLKV